MKKIINKQILEHLAELARIEIKTEKEEKLVSDLEKILDHFKELQEVSVEDIKSLIMGMESINVVNNDEIRIVDREISNDDLTGQFPDREGGFLKIPPVF